MFISIICLRHSCIIDNLHSRVVFTAFIHLSIYFSLWLWNKRRGNTLMQKRTSNNLNRKTVRHSIQFFAITVTTHILPSIMLFAYNTFSRWQIILLLKLRTWSHMHHHSMKTESDATAVTVGRRKSSENRNVAFNESKHTFLLHILYVKNTVSFIVYLIITRNHGSFWLYKSVCMHNICCLWKGWLGFFSMHQLAKNPTRPIILKKKLRTRSCLDWDVCITAEMMKLISNPPQY